MRVYTKQGILKNLEKDMRLILNNPDGEIVTVKGFLFESIECIDVDGNALFVDPKTIWDVLEAVKQAVEVAKVAIPIFKKLWLLVKSWF